MVVMTQLAQRLMPHVAHATIDTPIGRMIMTSDGSSLTELCLDDWWWAHPGSTAEAIELTSICGNTALSDDTAVRPAFSREQQHEQQHEQQRHAASPLAPHEKQHPALHANANEHDHHLDHDPHACNATDSQHIEVFQQTREWLAAYFAGERPTLASAPALRPNGTPFQREVWNLVAEIPYGETVSYGELAAELAERRGGGRMAAQAVGGAVKRNPITIIVPCHRVVGAGRSFGGYGGRLDIKAALLEHEGVDLSRFDL